MATGYCIGQHTCGETLRRHVFVGGAGVGKERETSRLVLHWHPGTMQLGAVVRIGRSVLWTEWTSFSLSPVLSRTRGFSVVLYVAFCFQGTVSFKVIESIGLSWFLISIPSVSLRIVAGCVVSKLPVWLLFSPNLCRGLIREDLPFVSYPVFCNKLCHSFVI